MDQEYDWDGLQRKIARSIEEAIEQTKRDQDLDPFYLSREIAEKIVNELKSWFEVEYFRVRGGD
jgi:hypothetical protein